MRQFRRIHPRQADVDSAVLGILLRGRDAATREPAPAGEAAAWGVEEAEVVAVADGGDVAIQRAAAEEGGFDVFGGRDAAEVDLVEA